MVAISPPPRSGEDTASSTGPAMAKRFKRPAHKTAGSMRPFLRQKEGEERRRKRARDREREREREQEGGRERERDWGEERKDC